MRIIILFIVCILLPMNTNAKNLKQMAKNSKAPVHITADKLEAYDKKGLYKFVGNVVAIRDDVKLTADKMDVFKNLKNGEIDRIVCMGNVVVTKEDKTAKADKAIYEDRQQKITLIGNSSVKSSKNSITSDIIVYYIGKDYAVAQATNRKKRVEVTIYPKNKKENR